MFPYQELFADCSENEIDWPFSTRIRQSFKVMPAEKQKALRAYIDDWTKSKMPLFERDNISDVLSRLPVDADSAVRYTEDETLVFDFFERGCGIFLVSQPNGDKANVNKFLSLPLRKVELYRTWYNNNRQFISANFIRFYLMWTILRDDDTYRRYYMHENEVKIRAAVCAQRYSLHCMYQWYVQGGDVNALPPQKIIDVYHANNPYKSNSPYFNDDYMLTECYRPAY